MNTINTTLTTSGNSVAVRLPKELLKMSGLTNRVTLAVNDGKIIIGSAERARETWGEQIKAMTATHADPMNEFVDMDTANVDGLEDLPWDGIPYDDWQSSK